MKIKSLSFLASCFIAACLYGCAGENNTAEQPDSGKQQPAPEGKAFAGFIDSTAAKAATRTGGIYGPLSNPSKTGIKFYWKTNETPYKMHINVGTDATPKWAYASQQKTLSTDADGHITQVLFYNFFHSSTGGYQKLDRESYKIRYIGNGASAYSPIGVNFTARQDQLRPNDAERISDYGDCGTATAVDNGIWYEFTLQHAAAYITFLPYAGAGASQAALLKCKLRSITIEADEAINGNFPFNDNGVDVSNRPAKNGSNNIIISYCNNNYGFEVASSKEQSREKSAVMMVLPPGTYHNVKITYNLYDPVVSTEGNFIKEIAQLTLPAGKNQPIASVLTCDDFSSRFDKYHMWGAKDYYWNSVFPASHNWESGGILLQPGSVPPSAGQGRFYYDQEVPHGAGNIAPVGTIDHDAPSANLLSWYVKYGDPRWDTQPFTYDGHLFTGRMWFLKKSVIAGLYSVTEQHMNDVSADGTDMRTYNGKRSFYTNTKKWDDVPNAQRANYFYVMPLGYYLNGRLYMQSNYVGYYWTSTAWPGSVGTPLNKQAAYYFMISPGYAYIESDYDGPNYRYYGYQVWQGEQ